MSNINEQIEKTNEQIEQLQNKKKKLMSKQKTELRKKRTKRLIERGANMYTTGMIANIVVNTKKNPEILCLTMKMIDFDC